VVTRKEQGEPPKVVDVVKNSPSKEPKLDKEKGSILLTGGLGAIGQIVVRQV